MSRVWFVMPVYRREALAAICLRQLARVCEASAEHGVYATAAVVGDDDATLNCATSLGFATVRRDNDQLGRKFNDGFQLACDPAYNPEPADYAVPVGSDNLLSPGILRTLPPADRIGVFRQQAVVSEDRCELSRLKLGYKYGCGIRIIPAGLIAACGYRPAAEDRGVHLDSSIAEGIKHGSGRAPLSVDLDVDPLQIVGLKSADTQIHSYREMMIYRRAATDDPLGALAEVYPEAVRELAAAGV